MKMRCLAVLVTLLVQGSPSIAYQTFDTAPRDTPIMAWVKEGHNKGFWSFIVWGGWGHHWCELGGEARDGDLPLYWMPLPDAPNESEWNRDRWHNDCEAEQ